MVVALGLILELFAWLGFSIAAIFLAAYGISRLLRMAWVETDAVIVPDGERGLARWLTEHGELHERPLQRWEQEDIRGADHCRVSYRRFAPHKARLARDSHGGRMLGILAIVFFGVGIAAILGSLLQLAIAG